MNVINLPNDEQLMVINEELGEDDGRMKNRIELITEWLKYQNHLPKNIDEKLLKNFIRLCKFDIGKIKKKLDLYFVSREKFKMFYDNREMTKDFLRRSNISKLICYLPELTKNGYRLVIVKPKDAEEFNFISCLKYGTLLFDYLLLEDYSSGVIIIYDFEDFTSSLMGKVNLIALRAYIKMYVDVLPFRICNIHVLNLPAIALPIITVIKAVLPRKLKERLIIHKNVEDLYKIVSRELLPVDLGGLTSTLEDISENWETVMTENDEFKKKLEQLQLIGAIPDCEEYFKLSDGEGSFRKLQID